MLDWLSAGGAYVSPGVEIAELVQNATGAVVRGLRATRSFEAGDTLFTIPFSLMLRSSVIAASGATRYALHVSNPLPMITLVSAILEASDEWAPYYDKIPRDYRHHPLWWHAFPQEYPRATRYVNRSKALRGLASMMRREVLSMQRTQYTLAAVSEKHRKVRARRAACDPRQFVRALVHVSSHHFDLAEAVDGTEFKALVPLFDMMNAPDGASDANVELLPRLMSLQGGASRLAKSIASSRAAGELELVCTAAVDIPSGHEPLPRGPRQRSECAKVLWRLRLAAAALGGRRAKSVEGDCEGEGARREGLRGSRGFNGCDDLLGAPFLADTAVALHSDVTSRC